MEAPYEIWQYIASYMTKEELRRLVTLNRPLYNIGMDAEYREVLWAKVDLPMLRSLSRLSSSPATARRVRRLDIRAWFLVSLSNRDARSVMEKSGRAPSHLLLPLPDLVAKSRSWVSSYLGVPAPLPTSSLNMASSTEDIFEAMIRSVQLMTSVTDYRFEWRDLPPSQQTLRLLGSARAAFGLSLRALKLSAPLSNFSHLISTVEFQSLEELDLYFDHDYAPPNPVLIRDAVTPFINHFRSSLLSLSISSSSIMDLSPLFAGLEKFPKLSKLCLCVAFDAVLWSDPSGFINMLHGHEELKNVSLSHLSAGSATSIQGWIQIHGPILTKTDSLRGLKYLQIPTFAPFSNTIQVLSRSDSTLSELVLLDHFLDRDQVVELVSLFSHRPFDAGLQRLHIGVEWLTPILFDILANRLPGLLSLNLVVPFDRATVRCSSVSEFALASFLSPYSIGFVSWST
ncbi:hypothetical protein C8J57DRAFT_1352625 [Mycena rebaudengoi]|nr:hypothetical protein C8J57DRAFT_1352625 [Mycena rebaudengoi]